ncbi:MAG: hypothetical protein ACE5IR_25805 [bacterium]
MKTVSLSYHGQSDAAWQSLTLNEVDDLYTAAIPNNLPSETISLHITGYSKR